MGGAGGISTKPVAAPGCATPSGPLRPSHTWPGQTHQGTLPSVQASLGTLLLTRHSSISPLPWLWDSAFLGLTPSFPLGSAVGQSSCPKSRLCPGWEPSSDLSLQDEPQDQPREPSQPVPWATQPHTLAGRAGLPCRLPLGSARGGHWGERTGLGITLLHHFPSVSFGQVTISSESQLSHRKILFPP